MLRQECVEERVVDRAGLLRDRAGLDGGGSRVDRGVYRNARGCDERERGDRRCQRGDRIAPCRKTHATDRAARCGRDWATREQCAQVIRQRGDRSVALFWFTRGGLGDDRGEIAPRLARCVGGRSEVHRCEGAQQRDRIALRESRRQRAECDFVEDYAERVDVRACVDEQRIAIERLRREVRGCAAPGDGIGDARAC